MTRPWRIYVADTSPLFRQGIRLMLDTLDREVQILETSAARGLRASKYRSGTDRIDLAILSSELFAKDDLHRLRRSLGSRTRVLLMSQRQHTLPRPRLPVDGLIDKSQSLETFKCAVEALMAGGTWFRDPPAAKRPPLATKSLSGKQQQVLALIGEGRSNKQIAARLHLSESTVKHHVTRIYRLLALDNPNRTQLALHASPRTRSVRTSADR